MTRHPRWRARRVQRSRGLEGGGFAVPGRVQRSRGVEGGGFAGLEWGLAGEWDPQGSPEGGPGDIAGGITDGIRDVSGGIAGGVPEGIRDGTRAVVLDREQALRALRMARARRLAIALRTSGQVARSR
jgi:hypothetical protein